MAVFRIEKTRDYTVMSNHHLRNTNLSLKAKGLLSLMLSLLENWDYTTKGLARICKDGVDSICAGVRELEEQGYVIRERVRNPNGQLGAIEYTILEQPRPLEREKPERENPVLDNPILGSPVLEEPEQGNPAQLNTKESSKQKSKTDLSGTELSNPIQSNPPIYEDNVSGKLSDDRFAKMSRRYEDEQKEISEKIKTLRAEMDKLSSKSVTADMFISTVRKYTRAKVLTPRMLNELIDHIEVHQAEKIDGIWEQHLVIHYNCVGAIFIPDVFPLPAPQVSVNTRKGVVVNYAPGQLAV